ncbi:protein translocase subunit SecD [Paracoccaceae bacterium GXU_MW_L88]
MLRYPLWKTVLVLLTCALGLFFAMPNLFYSRVESSNDAALLVEAGSTDPAVVDSANAWPSWLPDGLVNLGLDLRGGAHLLAEVNVEEVYSDRMSALWPQLRDDLRERRTEVGAFRRVEGEPGTLTVRFSDLEALPTAQEIADDLAEPIVSLTGAGQRNIATSIEADRLIIQLSDAEKEATDSRTMQQSLEIIRRRVDEAGTREPTIQFQGEDRILIQVPGIGSAQELKDLIGQTAKLTFNAVTGSAASADAPSEADEVVLPSADEDGVFYTVTEAPVIGGDSLTDAQPSFDQNGAPAVSFRFDPQGARVFGDYTAANIGRPFAIVLDNEVISAPVIQSHIPSGNGIITGNFDIAESNRLAVLLRAGALPASMTFLEERTIGPELGQDSIEAGRLAAMVALGAVVVYMILSYGLFGVFASTALLINIGLIFGLLSIIGGTLTLPGIAGIVLTIGMAVDANVLVYERIREELKTAKGPARAIELGYDRAFSAIVDANITTIMAAIILFVLGAGPVRGFAITLGLGIITSVFTALFVTRLFIAWWYDAKKPKTIEV